MSSSSTKDVGEKGTTKRQKREIIEVTRDGKRVVWTGTVYAKSYDHPRSFLQELTFYLEHGDALSDSIPALLSFCRDSRMLRLSVLGGQCVQPDRVHAAFHTTGDMKQKDISTCTYRAAGKWLRHLHDRPYVDKDTLGLDKALEKRIRSWLKRCQKRQVADFATRKLSLDTLTRTLAISEVSRARLASLPRVWCHRDYRPGNWWWDDEQESLAVLDFEHALPDLFLTDFVRLSASGWYDEQAAAFWEGYGRHLDAVESEVLAQLVLLDGISTLVWGLDHKDIDLITKGTALLHSCTL